VAKRASWNEELKMNFGAVERAENPFWLAVAAAKGKSVS